MYGPGRPFIAAKHSAVSSVMTGPPICVWQVCEGDREGSKRKLYVKWKASVLCLQHSALWEMVKGGQRGEKREIGGTRTNHFRCALAFFRGYLLRGALNLRNYYVPVSQNEIARPICKFKIKKKAMVTIQRGGLWLCHTVGVKALMRRRPARIHSATVVHTHGLDRETRFRRVYPGPGFR
jgi:hypothetical protein